MNKQEERQMLFKIFTDTVFTLALVILLSLLFES